MRMWSERCEIRPRLKEWMWHYEASVIVLWSAARLTEQNNETQRSTEGQGGGTWRRFCLPVGPRLIRTCMTQSGSSREDGVRQIGSSWEWERGGSVLISLSAKTESGRKRKREQTRRTTGVKERSRRFSGVSSEVRKSGCDPQIKGVSLRLRRNVSGRPWEELWFLKRVELWGGNEKKHDAN